MKKLIHVKTLIRQLKHPLHRLKPRGLAVALLRALLARRRPLVRAVDARVNPLWVMRRAAVSRSGKYCYFRIPKAANSTVVRTLAFYDPDLPWSGKDRKAMFAKHSFEPLPEAGLHRGAGADRGVGLHRGAGARGAVRAVSGADAAREFAEEYFCFTFVRNPYTRLLSAYLDKVARGRSVDRAAHRAASFAEFVAYLEAGGLWRDPHWVPQVALIPVPIDRLAFLGKVERLQDDLASLIDRLFGDGTFKKVRSRGSGRRNAAAQLGAHYTPELAARVGALYHDDFAAFGYSTDLATALEG